MAAPPPTFKIVAMLAFLDAAVRRGPEGRSLTKGERIAYVTGGYHVLTRLAHVWLDSPERNPADVIRHVQSELDHAADVAQAVPDNTDPPDPAVEQARLLTIAAINRARRQD
jgi:hypothetical protein